MILLGLAGTIAAHLSPPLDRPLHYRLVDRSYLATGEAVIDTAMTLRFARTAQGLTATATTDAVVVTAPPRQKHSLEALMDPLVGSATTVVIEPDGSAGAVIDGARSWAAHHASQQALLTLVDADPAMPAPVRAASRAALLRQIEAGADPVTRDDALRPSIAQLLAPGDRIAPGAPLRITTTLSTPGGPMQAASTITLAVPTPDRRIYHIETVTLPAAASAPAVRFAETSDIIVDGATGLLVSLRSRREVRRPGVAAHPISTREIDARP